MSNPISFGPSKGSAFCQSPGRQRLPPRGPGIPDPIEYPNYIWSCSAYGYARIPGPWAFPPLTVSSDRYDSQCVVPGIWVPDDTVTLWNTPIDEGTPMYLEATIAWTRVYHNFETPQAWLVGTDVEIRKFHPVMGDLYYRTKESWYNGIYYSALMNDYGNFSEVSNSDPWLINGYPSEGSWPLEGWDAVWEPVINTPTYRKFKFTGGHIPEGDYDESTIAMFQAILSETQLEITLNNSVTGSDIMSRAVGIIGSMPLSGNLNTADSTVTRNLDFWGMVPGDAAPPTIPLESIHAIHERTTSGIRVVVYGGGQSGGNTAGMWEQTGLSPLPSSVSSTGRFIVTAKSRVATTYPKVFIRSYNMLNEDSGQSVSSFPRWYLKGTINRSLAGCRASYLEDTSGGIGPCELSPPSEDGGQRACFMQDIFDPITEAGEDLPSYGQIAISIDPCT